jgi:hypothetical protein
MQVVLDEPIAVEENGLPPQIENEEDMGIRKEDWPLIHAELDKRIEALQPHGWQKFLNWAKEIGIIGSYLTLLASLLAIALSAVYVAVTRVAAQATFQSDTKHSLDEITQHLDKIDGTIATANLDRLSKLPITPQTIAEVSRVVRQAREEAQKIDPTVVSAAGQNYLQASVSQPEAWKAASELLQYKSSLNASSAASLLDQINYKNVTWTRSNPLSKKWEGRLGFIGKGEGANAADLREIESPGANLVSSPSYVVLNGGNVDLDGIFMKRVIIFNAHVIYRGRPTHLDTVYFINCTFDFDRQNRTSLMLADAVFAPGPATSFSGE